MNILCIIVRFTFYKVFVHVLNNNFRVHANLMEKQNRKSSELSNFHVTNLMFHHRTQPEQKLDSDIDLGPTEPLNNSAQKHKIAIKPKKRHSSSAHRGISAKKQKAEPGER